MNDQPRVVLLAHLEDVIDRIDELTTASAAGEVGPVRRKRMEKDLERASALLADALAVVREGRE